jgi:hypothetical protein
MPTVASPLPIRRSSYLICCIHSVHAHHFPWPSHRLFSHRSLRSTSRRPRCWRLSPSHHSTRLGCTHCNSFGRTALERLRPWLRHLPLYSYQHLRIHRLESVLTHDRQYWPPPRVRRRHRSALSSSLHLERQRACPEGSVLARPTPQCHEFDCYYSDFRHRHLPARLPPRDPSQVESLLRPAWFVSCEAVLYLKHAHHARVRSHFQRFHHISNARNSFSRQPPRETS